MKIADMHCDTISRIYHTRKSGIPAELYRNDFQLDIVRMKQSGYFLQNFAVFVDLADTDSAYVCGMEQISLFYEEMEKNRNFILPVKTYQDIIDCCNKGKLAALLTLEEGEICEGSLEKLREFYALGVRMMTFTWNYENSLGSPGEPADGSSPKGGLTPLGIEFLTEMESLGIIPDVSHLSDEGIEDVCRLAKKPIVASHSNGWSLCPRGRNLTDERIRQISNLGGVIGINYYGPFVTTTPTEDNLYYGRVSDLVRHIRHLTKIGGMDCVGLGSDFDGIDDYLELKDCSYMELLINALQKSGFHESEIDGFLGKNVLRVYREWL